jgi:CheY-like chemotaxis protein
MSTDKKYILVVEDNPIAAKMANLFLGILGCQIDNADDGDKAIEMAIKNSYDGICMDIGLPTVSGVDACIAIRKHEEEFGLSPVLIIALTSNDSDEEKQLYLDAGMQEIFSKPFTKEKAERFLSLCK